MHSRPSGVEGGWRKLWENWGSIHSSRERERTTRQKSFLLVQLFFEKKKKKKKKRTIGWPKSTANRTAYTQNRELKESIERKEIRWGQYNGRCVWYSADEKTTTANGNKKNRIKTLFFLLFRLSFVSVSKLFVRQQENQSGYDDTRTQWGLQLSSLFFFCFSFPWKKKKNSWCLSFFCDLFPTPQQ